MFASDRKKPVLGLGRRPLAAHGLPAFAVVIAALMIASPAPAQPVRIMVENASEPFSRTDGSGYANDLVRAAFHAANTDVVFDVVPYVRCKQSLLRGETPACFSMSWSPDLPSRIKFSRLPLYQVYADVYQRTDGKNHFMGFKDIPSGASVGIVNGYEYPEQVSWLGERGVKLLGNVDDTSNIQMLLRGRLDAVIIMASEFDDTSERLKSGPMRSAARSFRNEPQDSFIAFNVATARGGELERLFDTGYALISRDGEKERIHSHWLSLAR